MTLVPWIVIVAFVLCSQDLGGSQFLVTEEMDFPSYSESDTNFLFCDFRSVSRFQTERWTEMCSQCICDGTTVLCDRNRCPAFCRHRFRLLNDYCCEGCQIEGNTGARLHCCENEYLSCISPASVCYYKLEGLTHTHSKGMEGNVTEALAIGLTCPPSEWSFVERSHDEEWRLDGCTSCVCNNGTSFCESETCCSRCPSIRSQRNET